MTFQALLFCPDEKTARVTTQVLNDLEFSVESCTEPFAAVKKLMGQHFDAMVVDCENEQNAALLFKSARNSSSNQGSLAVAVVEGQTGVANAFRIGANLVLTKPINVEQAKSTLRVARGLLRKGGEAAKAAPPTPTATTTAPAPLPSRPASASLEAARPAAPTSSAPKPAFTAIQAPKPQPMTAVAKTTVEASSQYEVEQEPTPAPDAAEEILLESMNEKAPSMPPTTAASSKPESAAEFPWQPLAKPTGPMANSLQRAAEALQKKQAETAARVTSLPKPPAPPSVKQTQSLAGGQASGQAGSAAAPAPARESAPVIAPGTPKNNAPALTAAASQSITMETSKRDSAAIPLPTFGAPVSGSEESAEAGGGKKAIVIVAVVAVLAIAGYFGYTKLAGNKPSNPVPEVQTQPATTAAAPAITESTTAAATVVTPSNSTQPSHVASAPANKPAAAPVAADDETSAPEVVVTHPDAPKTMVVKSGMGSAAPKKKAEEATNADVPAPSLGISSEDQNTISNLVKSSPVSVPKVASNNSSDVLRISQGVTQGLLLKRVQPVYPHQAMQMRIQGAVQLQATINKQGSISSVKVLSGDAILARAAVEAVNQWKYKPYFLNGEPVDIQTQITVNFKLP